MRMWTCQQVLLVEPRVLKADFAGTAGGQGHQIGRGRNFHAAEIGGHKQQHLILIRQRRTDHNCIGKGCAGDPRAVAIQDKRAVASLGRQDRFGEVTAAGREMRYSDGGKNIAGRQIRQVLLLDPFVLRICNADASAGSLCDYESGGQARGTQPEIRLD